MRKKLFPLIAFAFLFPGFLLADSVLSYGTYAGDTRYAVKKIFDGNDDDLCWAASVSNAIQLWQDQWVALGGTIPSGTPNGQTQATYSTDVFATFVDNWINDGGDEQNGFYWWISGYYEYDPDLSSLKPGATGGNYWSSLNLDISLIAELIDMEDKSQDYLKSVLDDGIANDYYFTAGIYADGGAHAVSLWGYESLNDEIIGLWISDSDYDEFLGNVLVYVEWDEEEEMWHLGDVEGYDEEYYDWYLGDITQFTVGFNLIPEAAHMAFIFGSASIILCVFRKKKARPLKSGRA